MEIAAQFEYVYYSEADQILHVRGHAQLLAAASNVTANSAPVVIPHRATPLPLPRDLSPATLSRIGMGAESAMATDVEDATIASVIRRELRQNTAKQLHQAPRSSPPAGARCCWRSRRARTEYQDARVHLLAETSREDGRELPLGFAFALAEGDYWHARRTCHYAISEAGCDGSPVLKHNPRRDLAAGYGFVMRRAGARARWLRLLGTGKGDLGCREGGQRGTDHTRRLDLSFGQCTTKRSAMGCPGPRQRERADPTKALHKNDA